MPHFLKTPGLGQFWTANNDSRIDGDFTAKFSKIAHASSFCAARDVKKSIQASNGPSSSSSQGLHSLSRRLHNTISFSDYSPSENHSE